MLRTRIQHPAFGIGSSTAAQGASKEPDTICRHHSRGEASTPQGENVSHPFPHQRFLHCQPQRWQRLLGACRPTGRKTGKVWNPQVNLCGRSELCTVQGVLGQLNHTSAALGRNLSFGFASPFPKPLPRPITDFKGQKHSLLDMEGAGDGAGSPLGSWDKAVLLKAGLAAAFPR